MVEGRISAGVVVGDGSDVGGRRSIMGTLSGGGKAVISVGRRCLIGANAGIGISLGRRLRRRGRLLRHRRHQGLGRDGSSDEAKVLKAIELSGASNVLFRRNSTTGAVRRCLGGQGIANADSMPTSAARWTACASCSPVLPARRRGRFLCCVERGWAAPTRRSVPRRGGGRGLSTEQARTPADHAIAVRADAGRAASIALATRTRRASCATSTTGPRLARAVPAAALAGWGTPPDPDPSTRPTGSTTSCRRSTAISRCGSPRPRRRCSGRASPRPYQDHAADGRALRPPGPDRLQPGRFSCGSNPDEDPVPSARGRRRPRTALGDRRRLTCDGCFGRRPDGRLRAGACPAGHIRGSGPLRGPRGRLFRATGSTAPNQRKAGPIASVPGRPRGPV
jgi:hypothetical protein